MLRHPLYRPIRRQSAYQVLLYGVVALAVGCAQPSRAPETGSRATHTVADGSVPLVPDVSALGRGTLAHESRPILRPDQRNFSFLVPPNSALKLAFGVPRSTWTPGLKAVEVTVTARQGKHAAVLLRRVLERPARAPQEEWLKAVLPLAAYTGGTLDVALDSKPLGAAAAGAGVVWGVPRLLDVTAGRKRGDGKAPNVLLISIDTLRPDHLGSYGYERATTPNIDRLARDSVRFDQAFSTSGWTLPAHASMFTGLLPCHHGSTRFGHDTPLAQAHDTIAERFRAAGYVTAAFTGGVFVSLDLGFDQGFDMYRDPGFLPAQQPRFAEIVAQAERWIEAPGAGPFFLFLHTYEVHMPYNPPPPYNRAFAGAADGPFADGVTMKQMVALGTTREQVPRAEVRQLEALYDGGIRSMDAALGDLLAFLDARGLAQNTCVALTSDHGEEFQEHGNLFHHHGKLYDEIVRVPLIIHCPPRLPAGTVVDVPVSLTDLMPTLLDLADLPALPGLDGRSLLPTLASGAWPDRPIISGTDGSAAGRVGVTRAIRRDGLKLITSTLPDLPPQQLFDLTSDPGEQLDLHAVRPAAVAALSSALTTAIARPFGESVDARIPDAATVERMRALGYAE